MTFAAAPDQAPKRNARRKTTSKASAPSYRAGMRRDIDAFVVLLNEFVKATSPYDALQPKEVSVLVNALDEQAKKSASFRRVLEGFLTVTSGGSLGLVAGIIIGRRLARRRVFGAKFSPLVDTIGGVVIETMDVPSSEANEAMESVMSMMSELVREEKAGGNGTDAESAS